MQINHDPINTKIGPIKATGGEFLRVLAHDIRNPLAVIVTTLELIRAEGINLKKTPTHLDMVEVKVRALSRLVDELLNDSHIPHDASTFSLKPKRSSRKRISSVVSTTEISHVLKVLIVDDNRSAADALSQLLALRGCEIEVAYSGAQALQKTLTFSPQIAILDIGMPEMDGYDLVSKLRERKLPCVYIALTGYGRIVDKKKALKAGFDHHFTKPAGLKEIEVVLQKVSSTMWE